MDMSFSSYPEMARSRMDINGTKSFKKLPDRVRQRGLEIG